MTLPSEYTINLPATIQTSFWPSGPCTPTALASVPPEHAPPDPNGPPGSVATYRLPLVRLYSFLQAGADLNMRVAALVSQRARAESSHADTLSQPTSTGADLPPLFPEAGLHARSYTSLAKLAHNVPGFSSAIAWAQLEADTQGPQARAHQATALALEERVVDPFSQWTKMHHDRLRRSWNVMDSNLDAVERLSDQVSSLRVEYEAKCRLADEAEQAARFAPLDGQPVPSLSESRRQHLRERSEATSSSTTSSDPAEGASDPADSVETKRHADLRAQFGFKDRTSPRPPKDASDTPVSSPRTGGLAGLGASLQRAGTLSLHRLEEAARSASAASAAAAAAARSSSAAESVSGSHTAGAEVRDGIEGNPNGSDENEHTPDLTPTSIWGNVRAAVAGGLAAASGAAGGSSKHVRLRKESQECEDRYLALVEELDHKRCEVEQAIYAQLGLCDQWEKERTKAVQTALEQYTEALKPLSKVYGARASHAGRQIPVQMHRGAQRDFDMLVRGYGTGPYTPLPQVFHPFYHHELDSLEGMGSFGFGMNLVKWDRARALAISFPLDASGAGERGSGILSPLPAQGAGLPDPPRVLRLLLTALDRAYGDENRWPVPPELLVGEPYLSQADQRGKESTLALARSAEKRKIWLYEVPLAPVHALRFRLIQALKEAQEAEMAEEAQSGPAILPTPALNARSDDGGEDQKALAHGAGAGLPSHEGKVTQRDERMLGLLASYDPPILAALVKMWAAELEESLVPQTSWDMVWSLYRAAAGQEQALGQRSAAQAEQGQASSDNNNDKGKDKDKDKEAEGPLPLSASSFGARPSEQDDGLDGQDNSVRARAESGGGTPPSLLTAEQKDQIHQAIMNDLRSVLTKLPKVHLSCLALWAEHLSRLYTSTGGSGSTSFTEATTSGSAGLRFVDPMYTSKLGRSIGRSILRPARELGQVTTAQQHPYLLSKDLVQFYTDVFPPVMQMQQRASQSPSSQTGFSQQQGGGGGGGRPTPVRRRTRPIDMRPSRSSIAAAARVKAAQGRAPQGLGLSLDPIASPPASTRSVESVGGGGARRVASGTTPGPQTSLGWSRQTQAQAQAQAQAQTRGGEAERESDSGDGIRKEEEGAKDTQGGKALRGRVPSEEEERGPQAENDRMAEAIMEQAQSLLSDEQEQEQEQGLRGEGSPSTPRASKSAHWSTHDGSADEAPRPQGVQLFDEPAERAGALADGRGGGVSGGGGGQAGGAELGAPSLSQSSAQSSAPSSASSFEHVRPPSA